MLFQKLSTMNVKFDITIVNIIIGAFYRVRRNQEAKDLFATIPSNGLVANAVTYSIMMINLIKKGSVEEADNLFLSMEKSGCTADSCMLNHIIRRLLEQGEIVKAGNYMSKVDAKSYKLEAKTVWLLISLFSRKGKYREHIKLLSTKYQFLEQAATVELLVHESEI
ncbi:hypothetical protein ZWY2020_054465 [Hordeum vulgare]|nr:hypothetical protein ZWY2020_054465 [Hordeum vulgare]